MMFRINSNTDDNDDDDNDDDDDDEHKYDVINTHVLVCDISSATPQPTSIPWFGVIGGLGSTPLQETAKSFKTSIYIFLSIELYKTCIL